jgi:preprotein translocase subunit SecE
MKKETRAVIVIVFQVVAYLIAVACVLDLLMDVAKGAV